jgi:hypothetical protein
MMGCHQTPPSHEHVSCGPLGSICGEIHFFPGPFHIQGSGKGVGSPRGHVTHGPLAGDETDKHWMRTVGNCIRYGYTRMASDGNPGTCWGEGLENKAVTG